MGNTATAIRLGLPVLLVIGTVGCGARDPWQRQAISGSVTFDGQPLDQGAIAFEPQQKPGVAGGAVIAGGEYTIAAEKGLPPGKYLVRIYSTEGGGFLESPAGPPGPPGPATPGPGGGVLQEECIPAEFNQQSTHVVKVTAEGANRFDFDINRPSP